VLYSKRTKLKTKVKLFIDIYMLNDYRINLEV
jgi:hypothetical protein